MDAPIAGGKDFAELLANIATAQNANKAATKANAEPTVREAPERAVIAAAHSLANTVMQQQEALDPAGTLIEPNMIDSSVASPHEARSEVAHLNELKEVAGVGVPAINPAHERVSPEIEVGLNPRYKVIEKEVNGEVQRQVVNYNLKSEVLDGDAHLPVMGAEQEAPQIKVSEAGKGESAESNEVTNKFEDNAMDYNIDKPLSEVEATLVQPSSISTLETHEMLHQLKALEEEKLLFIDDTPNHTMTVVEEEFYGIQKPPVAAETETRPSLIPVKAELIAGSKTSTPDLMKIYVAEEDDVANLDNTYRTDEYFDLQDLEQHSAPKHQGKVANDMLDTIKFAIEEGEGYKLDDLDFSIEDNFAPLRAFHDTQIIPPSAAAPMSNQYGEVKVAPLTPTMPEPIVDSSRVMAMEAQATEMGFGDESATSSLANNIMLEGAVDAIALEENFAELINDNVLITHSSAVAKLEDNSVKQVSPTIANEQLDKGQFEKVEFAIQSFRDKGGQTEKISIQLEPLNLGQIELTFTREDNNSIKLDIACESFNTLTQLRSSEDRINAILADNGFNTESSTLNFSFSDKGQSGGAMAMNEGDDRNIATSLANDNYDLATSSRGIMDIENDRVDIKV